MTRLLASMLAVVFRFFSGVARNARTFHPDGRTFFGTVQPAAADPTLACAGAMLQGRVLMRIGMGVAKRNAPPWFKRSVPDAPSVAVRFSPALTTEAISVAERGKDELDILFTAGGDRLWKLIANLVTGGRCFGLNQFDYFRNRYFADVPYRIPGSGLDLLLRLNPEASGEPPQGDRPDNPERREQALTEAASRGAVLVIEAQPTADGGAAFAPVAKIRFDGEIDLDQEALHFQPTAGRGFEPHGILTLLRETVYPASANARPPNRADRETRDRAGLLFRLFHRTPAASEVTAVGAHRSVFKRIATAVGLLFAALLLVTIIYGVERFVPNYPMTNPPDAKKGMTDYALAQIDEQRFKYGSTGGEANLGFPLPMWQAAPLVCAETLKKVVGKRMAADFVTRVRNYTPLSDGRPDEGRLDLAREGYKAFGLIYEKENGKERDIPVGVSKRRHLGFDRVFVNCAFCHTSTVRVAPDSEPKLVLGMPANLLNIHQFEDFLFRCTSGPDFSKENLIPEIENMNGRLSPVDRYLLYPLAIWIVRDRVQFLQSRLGFFAKQPAWGPGRVDTFSNAKGIFNWPWQKLPNWYTDKRVEPDQIGTVDFPSIWRQRQRKTRADACPMELHWDGNNDAVEERNLSAAFGTGALPPIIDHDTLEKIEDWLADRSVPPKFTEFGFPASAFDPQLADKGKPIYEQYCAACHGRSGTDFTGARVGYVTPLTRIGTDPYRLRNYTDELATIQSMLYTGERKPGPATVPAPRDKDGKPCGPFAYGDVLENSYRFKRFRKTDGYANSPLDGVWLRAPYLHNGSVPTLRDLLQPVAKRPSFYFRGNDEYDTANMGFKSETETRPDGRSYFRYDTQEPGNSNAGHEGEPYGTNLSDADKSALIEYLKTF